MGLLDYLAPKYRGLLAQGGTALDALRGGLLGATVDSVGYIPDAVADAMRPFGYDVPRDQVVGGTDWLANKVTSPTGTRAETIGRLAGGLLTPGPEDVARMTGLLAPKSGPMQELITYHGSPHRINNIGPDLPSQELFVNVNGKPVRVWQNPTLEERGRFTSAARADRGVSKVMTRQTKDDRGNLWIWDSDDTIHSWMEPELSKSVGRELNQNMDIAHPMGKFDLSKVGTGEGWQAYGHGIYLAETPDVARQYATDRSGVGRLIATGVDNSINESIEKTAQRAVDTASDPDAAAKHMRAVLKANSSSKNPWQIEANKKTEQVIALIESGKVSKAGHLYTVDLPDEHIAKMLDWDAPLSEQPESVRKAITDLGITPESLGKVAADKVRKLAESKGLADWARRDLLADAVRLESAKSIQQIGGTLKRMPLEYGINPDGGPFQSGAKDFLALVKATEYVPNMDTGGGAYGLLSALRGGDKAATDFLRPYGIPGIKYFDGGSRSAGEGTRNFVIFDGDTAKILKRE